MTINPNTIATIATIAIAFSALIFTIVNTNRTAKKELVSEVTREDNRFDSLKESIVKMNVKLDTVCSTTNETRTDVKTMNKEITQVQAHMVALDERTLSLDHRLTILEAHVFEKENDAGAYYQSMIEQNQL